MMGSFGTEIAEPAHEQPEDSDEDPKPSVPLRQRKLPASFWQEPCLAQSPSAREMTQPTIIQPSNHQFSMTSMHPWTVNSNAMMPIFVPQRIATPPSHLLLQQSSNPQWLGNSSCCSCASCLNYSYVIPRLPDVYNGLRYRPAVSVPSCCPAINCTDQNCKMCTAVDRWHPERLRHFRLRASRYNAILD